MAGIDFGNMNCYLAVARNKGIEILINDYSLHATPSCVSFGQTNRLMGFGAKQQVNAHYKNSVLNFKHLLGKNFSDPVVQKLIPFVPCKVIQLDGDTIGFEVTHLDQKRHFTPVQILACLFTHLRLLLSKSTGADTLECVLNVPYFFDENQRLALIKAGKIAGINFYLINDHSALAYNYGMYKCSELPQAEEAPKLVVFVDCGHSAVQTSLVAFSAQKAEVIGAAHDLSVGGLYFDALIRDDFAKQFKQKYKIDVHQNPRAWLRLLDECERLKKQMSANSQPIPLNIECLMNDVDVNGSMQRADFEERAEPLFKKLEGVLQRLLQTARVRPEQIADVELIGGSSRVPRIKQIIAEFFKKEPRTTMNQDDAVARGCALRCATFYPAYRMKEYLVVDPFDLVISNEKLPTEEELVEYINAEQEMQAADQRDKERSDAKNALEEYIFRVQHAMEDEKLCQGKLADDLRLACMSECGKVLDWLDAESEQLQKKQIECRHLELEQFCGPMMDKLYAVAEPDKGQGEQMDGTNQSAGGEPTVEEPNND